MLRAQLFFMRFISALGSISRDVVRLRLSTIQLPWLSRRMGMRLLTGGTPAAPVKEFLRQMASLRHLPEVVREVRSKRRKGADRGKAGA